jgi:hypothetical protein
MSLILNARDLPTKYGTVDRETPLTDDEKYIIRTMRARQFGVGAIGDKIRRPRAMVREFY